MAKRSKSSKQWLAEHHSDHWVLLAQKEGWRSRSVFKLQEIDDKDHLLQPGMRLVDLGAAPGGWSQYATRRLKGRGTIVATDILAMDALEQVDFVQGDFTEEVTLAAVRAALGSEPADLVMSDMAPNLSGMGAVDQPRSMYLAELAIELAREVLRPGGAFLVKVFQGVGFDSYIKDLRGHFEKVVTRKPKASRPRSREVYLVGKGFKPSV
jgi:23S rRNA (uridine2552-2'-O)-methyltransferase